MQKVLSTSNTQLGLTWTNFTYTWQYGEPSIQCPATWYFTLFAREKTKPHETQ